MGWMEMRWNGFQILVGVHGLDCGRPTCRLHERARIDIVEPRNTASHQCSQQSDAITFPSYAASTLLR